MEQEYPAYNRPDREAWRRTGSSGCHIRSIADASWGCIMGRHSGMRHSVYLCWSKGKIGGQKCSVRIRREHLCPFILFVSGDFYGRDYQKRLYHQEEFFRIKNRKAHLFRNKRPVLHLPGWRRLCQGEKLLPRECCLS